MGVSNVFFGFVDRTEIPRIQADASALVLALPTGNGNLCLPSKMTSYMLSSRPIIASVDRDSATTRYIHESDCGISVIPDDIDALSDGFKQIAEMSSEERHKMGANGRLFAEQHLTRKVNLQKVCDMVIRNLKHI